MYRTTVLLGLAGALLLGLVGCQGEPSRATGEPPLGPVPTIRDAREISLPLDAYLAITLQWHVPDLAINRLGRECMRGLGLDWPIVGVVPPDSTAPRYGRRYGIFDADRVARHGYQPLPGSGGAAGAAGAGGQEGPRREREPTDLEAAVWTGRGESKVDGRPVPEGGCGAEALRKLAGGVRQPPEIRVEMMANEALQRAERHSRTTATFERWSRCMSQRGFNYRRPSDANDDPRWDTGHATPAEIETAKADVACKLETNLVGVWHAAEVAYQKRAIEQNATRLQAVKEYHDTVQRNAAKIVAAG